MPELVAGQDVVIKLQADEFGAGVVVDLEKAEIARVRQRPHHEDAEQDHHRGDHQVRGDVVLTARADRPPTGATLTTPALAADRWWCVDRWRFEQSHGDPL